MGLEFKDNISETLLINLYFRALENEMPDPILKDPFSGAIVQQILNESGYDFEKFKRGKMGRVGTVIRARYFDDMILNFAREYTNKLVIVQVGAGLDTRPLRLENTLKNAIFYDLDLPDVIALRDRLVPKAAQNFSIASSMFETKWMDELHARHTGAKFIFVLEGVAMYFTYDQMKGFVKELAARFNGILGLDILNRFTANLNTKHNDVLKYIKDPPQFKFGIDDLRELESWHSDIKLQEAGVMMSMWRDRWSPMARIFSLIPALRNSCRMCVYAVVK